MTNPRLSAKSAGKKKPTILITGASQGIGAEIAKTFAQEIPGSQLVLVARNERKLQGVARACNQAGASAAAFTCDVSDEAAVARLKREVAKACGSVDVLINNAGAFTMAPFMQTKVSEFDRLIAVNLRSAFLMTQAFLPPMLRSKKGDIFFMSSIAGLGAYPNATAYCAAKFGVTGLAKVLRAETKDKGVRVCCVHPGATWSPSWSESGVKPERIMPAGDIARAMLEVYRLSRNTVVEELVLRPQRGDL